MKQMWNDKRYHSFDYYLKNQFGRKLYKLSLDGNMTCPNRDGTLDTRGCIFCSAGGSGDFAADVTLSITKQIEEAKEKIAHKVIPQIGVSQYIAYFQAFTNTYAPVDYLRQIFMEAIHHPDIAVVSIATRPDCLGPDVLALLAELNQIKPIWIELGLQTIHETSAKRIRRGYPLSTYDTAVKNLRALHIEVIVHLIIGLPYETKEDILKSVDYVSASGIQGVKLQLLHVLKDTDLVHYLDTMHVLTLEEYISILLSCIEHLDPAIVIHRITGDGPKDLLLAPLWSGNKKLVLNTIQHSMKLQDSWQGKNCMHATVTKEVVTCNQKL
ncbi:TIGR01212 family radical SAM protein [Anaerosporobacter faecicola]|uniref:TIGR01212 family radical SAM protein n=1 Tax=Anaerosporobacter faecicola TaxID=2718714 RepID=UPI00143B6C17|nr:TIGR01212 family radical SAM protein [Anaerosporobacter faecicola]